MTLTPTFVPASVITEFVAPSVQPSTGTPIARELVERNPYTGDYTITPSAEEQVLETKGLRMTDNLTINPIPSNYGLITWNGSTITVS